MAQGWPSHADGEEGVQLRSDQEGESNRVGEAQGRVVFRQLSASGELYSHRRGGGVIG